MEVFEKAKSVRLRSHLNKFLVADQDEKTVRQSRNGESRKARWTVEMVEGKSHVIRLRSCHGKYLTSTEEPFLLGMTGNIVIQAEKMTEDHSSVEWQPIREGGSSSFVVRLSGKEGKFLRANWGTPPWRNSVTHDVPKRTATQDWVLWEVEIVEFDQDMSNLSPAVSISSSSSCLSPLDDGAADESRHSSLSDGSSGADGQGGMEIFQRAKAIRLLSRHGKYLVAGDDKETVCQDRNGSARDARWTIEHVKGKPNLIRLKSCHGLYLSAMNEPFLLGLHGKKVQQCSPHAKFDPGAEWEPLKEGAYLIKLRTSEGKYLRANSGTPPWRNSVTHDVPHRNSTQDWVLWEVDVVAYEDTPVLGKESVSGSRSIPSNYFSVVRDVSRSGEASSHGVVACNPEPGSSSDTVHPQFIYYILCTSVIALFSFYIQQKL